MLPKRSNKAHHHIDWKGLHFQWPIHKKAWCTNIVSQCREGRRGRWTAESSVASEQASTVRCIFGLAISYLQS